MTSLSPLIERIFERYEVAEQNFVSHQNGQGNKLGQQNQCLKICAFQVHHGRQKR